MFFCSREGSTYSNALFAQINEFVKRARAAKIHSYIISHLRKEMPAMMGKAKAQQRLIDNLEDEFKKVNTFTETLLCSCLLYVNILFSLMTGSKRLPFTSRRLSKCRTFSRDLKWLQHRQV